MKRTWKIVAFAALGSAALIAAGADAAPRAVRLLAVDGVNSDSVQTQAFLDAFRSALGENSVPTESRDTGGWKKGPDLANAFEFPDDARADQAWGLRVVVGLPPVQKTSRRATSGGSIEKVAPRKRSSRGMSVAVIVLPPDTPHPEAAPDPVRTDVAFPAPRAPDGGMLALPPGGYEFPWAKAGRVAGLLALEALHRRDGLLGDGARVALGEAVRVERGE